MEIVIKCDQSEEAVVYAAVSKLCPNLSDVLCKDIEVRSLDVKFLKNNEEVRLYMSPDVSRMAIRKLSAVGNVFQILWHIMNDSLADLVDKMGEFDVLVNGEFLDDEEEDNDSFPEDLVGLLKDRSNIPTIEFSGI